MAEEEQVFIDSDPDSDVLCWYVAHLIAFPTLPHRRGHLNAVHRSAILTTFSQSPICFSAEGEPAIYVLILSSQKELKLSCRT